MYDAGAACHEHHVHNWGAARVSLLRMVYITAQVTLIAVQLAQLSLVVSTVRIGGFIGHFADLSRSHHGETDNRTFRGYCGPIFQFCVLRTLGSVSIRCEGRQPPSITHVSELEDAQL